MDTLIQAISDVGITIFCVVLGIVLFNWLDWRKNYELYRFR